MKATAVIETCIYCDDLSKAARFYTDVLGLEMVALLEGRHVFFRCGQGMVLVFNPHATAHADEAMKVPVHGAHGQGHLAFRVSEDELEPWRAQLRIHGVAIETEIAWPHGGHSIYFRDPAGNSLELCTPATWGLQSN